MDNPPNPDTQPPVVPPPATPPAPPPVLAPTPRERPRAGRSGRGWMILSLILLVLLAISFLGNLKSLVLALLPIAPPTAYVSGPQLREVVVEDNRSSAKIALIDIDGVIYGGYVGAGDASPVELAASQLQRAREDPHVKAVILRINSPGGEVLAADEIARAVTEFQDKSGKPVIVSMEGLAASGGYYVAAPCRWIVANELSLTGSIGVIMHGYNYRGLLDKVGVRPQVYKSGKFKDMLSGDKKEVTPEEDAMIQKLIEETFERFKAVVAEGRARANRANEGKGRKLAENWQDFADGRVLSGKQAYDLGFVDELGTFKTAVSRAKAIAGVASANLVRYQQPPSFTDFFRLFGKAESTTVKLDVGLDLPKLEIGRLYFLFAPGAR